MIPCFHITANRVGDVSIIELFVRAGYSGEMLESLNRVRKFYQVHLLLDVLCAEGCTVDMSLAFSRQTGLSTRVFSWEQPTTSDFNRWEWALRRITSSNSVLPTPLGHYLQEPHIPYEWLASSAGALLFQLTPDGYNTFTPPPLVQQRGPGPAVKRR
jgi:hypothetical protein